MPGARPGARGSFLWRHVPSDTRFAQAPRFGHAKPRPFSRDNRGAVSLRRGAALKR